MEDEAKREKLERLVLSYLMYDDLRTYRDFKLHLNIRYDTKVLKKFEITERSNSERGSWIVRFSYDLKNENSHTEMKGDRPIFVSEPYERNINYCIAAVGICIMQNAAQIKRHLKEILK